MKTKNLIIILVSAGVILGLAGWGSVSYFSSSANQASSAYDSANIENYYSEQPMQTTVAAPIQQASYPSEKEWIDQQTRTIDSQANNLDPSVLKLSLAVYEKARTEGLDNKQILTIIDYSKPSSEKRLWVIDLKTDKVLFNTWVSHGKNSGDNDSTSFSNQPGSLKSSIGVFLTEQTYVGGDGYSLRLAGLEQGINDNAYSRNIVIHGARYVSSDTIRAKGRLGRSWGCPAVNPALARPLIDTIKEKTLVVAYYPDRHWLNNSNWVNNSTYFG